MPLPDYRKDNLLNLMGSLLKGLGGEFMGYSPLEALSPPEIHEYRRVVLIVVDGLGWEFLSRTRRPSCLKELTRTRLGSVFPSTTAAAVTSFLTGVAPQQHGLTGWHMYFRELGTVLAVLPGVPRYGGCALGKMGVNVEQFYGHRPIFDLLPVPSHIVVPRHIANSDFNRSHRGKAEAHPFDTQPKFFQNITRLVHADRERKFIYAYWSDFDRVSHEAGAYSAETRWHFDAWEEGFMGFLDSITGSGTLVIVTADHGFIDTDEAHIVNLDDHPQMADCLLLPLCGESRVAYCYVKSGFQAFFEGYVRSELGTCAELWESRELIERGWFGLGAPHPRLADRIGDYTLVMRENYVLKEWLPTESRFEQIGVHGGLSDAEMWVPLIVAAV